MNSTNTECDAAKKLETAAELERSNQSGHLHNDSGKMILQKLTTAAVLTLLLTSLAPHLRAEQTSTYGLEEYLNRKMVGPESVKVIIDHLNAARTNSPLDNLVTWSKDGFPDLHDEHGIWKTESIGLKLGIVHSIHYYFSISNSTDKSNRYLDILDELRRDDYISYHLAQMAFLVVDEFVLESKVLQLLQEKDPKLREQAVLMGTPLAKEKRSISDQFLKMVQSDSEAQVRTTILYSIIQWRSRDVAYVAFERLLKDSDANVRDWGARGLWSAADRGILTGDDLPKILAEILKTNEPFVRISIGRTAARMTTDRSLAVHTDKITDELLTGYLKRVKSLGAEADLVQEWLEWWTPLIPSYTSRPKLVY
jgi:hypothetical protein